MTRFGGFLTAGLLRFVEPGARAVVHGDLEELNLGSLRSVWEVCGLIARQQAGFWKDWRPWLALFGIVGLIGGRLTMTTLGLTLAPARFISTYRSYGVLYQSGLTLNEDLFVWFSMAAAVILLSWTAGASLAAGATCTITVTFQPVTYGTFTSTLTVTESSGALDTVLVAGISTVNN
jgi:hypothetical protein